MKIRPARPDQSIFSRYCAQPISELPRVSAVVAFESIQSHLPPAGQTGEHPIQSAKMQPRMRPDCGSSGGMKQFARRSEREPHPVNIRPLPLADPDVERLFIGRQLARFNQMLGDVRSTEHPARGLPAQLLQCNAKTGFVQLPDDLHIPDTAGFGEIGERPVQRVVSVIESVTEEVQRGLFPINREFHSRNNANAAVLSGGKGFVESVERVVIGQGEDFNAALASEGDQFGRRETSVGGG